MLDDISLGKDKYIQDNNHINEADATSKLSFSVHIRYLTIEYLCEDNHQLLDIRWLAKCSCRTLQELCR